MSVNFNTTSVHQIFRTYVGSHVVSTIWLDDPNLLPFYETIIFSTATVPDDKDILNGIRMSCVMKTNALKMHKNCIQIVKKVKIYGKEDEDEDEDEIIEHFTMLNVIGGFDGNKSR